MLSLALAGGFAWRHREAWLPQPAAPVAVPSAPAAAAAFDVCALAPRVRVAAALGVAAVEVRHVGAGADVPAAGSCTFDFERGGRRGSVVALAFTSASLERGDAPADAHAYFDSVVTGLEYALKDVPQTIAGLGDEAASAGFDGGAGPAQLVARRGDLVLHLVVRGADRDAAQRLARELIASR